MGGPVLQREEHVKLHYCETRGGNFGDDMNLWFWDDVMPHWRDIRPDTTMSGIGTLINQTMVASYPKILVCGSGTGYGKLAAKNMDHVSFAWVRGPHTAELLGLSKDAAVTDPACLVADLPRFATAKAHKTGTVFVPHRLTANLNLDWQGIGQRAGLDVVLPMDDAVSVIERIRDADLVIAESMHGAIIADAFRVPWIAVAVSHHFNTFKWQDWSDSLEMPLHVNEALHLPRDAYFFLRRQRQGVRSLLGARTKTIKAASAGKRRKAAFENPNYLGKGERDTVKDMVSKLGPIVERLLARDLRRLTKARPALSADHVLANRKDEMRTRIEGIERVQERAS